MRSESDCFPSFPLVDNSLAPNPHTEQDNVSEGCAWDPGSQEEPPRQTTKVYEDGDWEEL